MEDLKATQRRVKAKGSRRKRGPERVGVAGGPVSAPKAATAEAIATVDTTGAAGARRCGNEEYEVRLDRLLLTLLYFAYYCVCAFVSALARRCRGRGEYEVRLNWPPMSSTLFGVLEALPPKLTSIGKVKKFDTCL